MLCSHVSGLSLSNVYPHGGPDERDGGMLGSDDGLVLGNELGTDDMLGSTLGEVLGLELDEGLVLGAEDGIEEILGSRLLGVVDGLVLGEKLGT